MLGILLPKGQGDGLGEAGLVAQVEQSGGITGGVRSTKRADHGLVRGGLNVSSEKVVGKPENGIEPVEAECDIGQGLRQIVPAADVGLFMEQDVAPVGFRQADGQIDAGAEETADEGAVDLIRLIDIFFDENGVCNSQA